nr:glutaredoxin-like, thioredoxin-like fold protein [Tanacetum cinerariifolium]
MTTVLTAAAAIILHPARRTSPITNLTRRLTITASSSKKQQLILYSKPGCCLCDGLKEKLNSAFTLSSTPQSLHDVELQIRDITSNPVWEKAYQYEIPVLARLRSDGTEEVIPRFSPRAGVDHIQTKLAAVLSKDN